ncbi:MAG: excinuclease ABC subunit UvrA [Armatimonadota bacterium]|nr:excinuclease ABC subunit UvrA [Armatimonadota bacterium]
MSDTIRIRGARQHNLRDIDLDLPKGKLIAFTGVSGSGKSSLAFDTIFAEGQRRYVESLSNYAKQFLRDLPRPDVDEIEGLTPTIAVDQAARSHNPRSTVATITEIYDHLRVLFAAIGVPHCPQCGRDIGSQSRDAIIARILAEADGQKAVILAPVARRQKGEFQDLFEDMLRRGWARARVDGDVIELRDPPQLDRQRFHDVEIVTDRITIMPRYRARIADAVEQALELSEGTVVVAVEGEEDLMLSSRFACADCGLSFETPTHAHFSFNSPKGMCPDCDGLGERREFVPELIVSDPQKSLREGCIELMRSTSNARWRHWLEGVANHYGFTLDTPWKDLTDQQRHHLLYGSDGEQIEFYFKHPWRGWEWRHADPWDGLMGHLMRRYKRLKSRSLRRKFEDAMRTTTCSTCGGKRLRPESLAVTVGGVSIGDIAEMTVSDARDFFDSLQITEAEAMIAEDALKEIRSRLRFLSEVGLDYLSLNRTAPTLSGGEAQRIRLAGQVGSGLVDVLYILDEPSIGLHHRDQGQLLKTLEHLRDSGNTIIVVEHDEQTIRAADYVVDFGPGAGQRGGEIVAMGTPKQIARRRASITGSYLSGRREIPVPEQRRNGNGQRLLLQGARHNNLRDLDVEFPLGRFITITGVSGSGKSSLVTDTLHAALARELQGAQSEPGEHDSVQGLEELEKVVLIDQDPIGRTPRSNPATYVGVFDHIRKLFSQLPGSRQRGYKPGRFSFNVSEGRCAACEGYGAVKLESDFLADVWVTCEACNGRRFDDETLKIRYRGKNIADVLEMEVGEAIEHFSNQPKIRDMLQIMADVGLGYIKLGQPAPTLSGGEAQRVKLAEELARPRSGRNLYILDEPTTGLHFADVQDLLNVLHRFVDEGNTVIVVEHHPDIIKSADWVIDLGPEGGEEGGDIVVCGTPEQVAECEQSYTGAMLREVLEEGEVERPDVASARRRKNIKTGDIEVSGAREHNLRAVDVKVPRHQLTAVSGVSGSGKTSLALDTIYAEGQRRYVESLSSYARQFVGQIDKPKVDRVTGLPPAVAIDQKQPSHNPRSTVGTVTTIYDYMRVLFARLATPHCPECGAEVGSKTQDQIAGEVLADFRDQRVLILAPVEPRGNEEWADLFDRLQRAGWVRVRIDGEVERLPVEQDIQRRRRHTVEVAVDRIDLTDGRRSRLAEAVEAALDLSGGRLTVAADEADERTFSQHHSCEQCGAAYEPLSPRSFSFNHREGWCPECEGLGTRRGADPRALVPDPTLSIREGALSPWGELRPGSLLERMLQAVARDAGFDLDTPFEELSEEHRRLIFYGAGDREFEVDQRLTVRFGGLVSSIEETSRLSSRFRKRVGRILRDLPCPACHGGRVNAEAAAARLRGQSIVEVGDLPLTEAEEFFAGLELSDREQEVAGEILEEIVRRLRLLVNIGLGYLTLNRSAPSLSGGETQRVRLAGQIGSGLTGVLYVLDEPTVGVHPSDNERMLEALKDLRDLGNTALVVEHDEQTLREADHLIDLGPGSGPEGGRVVASGTLKQVQRRKTSRTGQLLAGELQVPVPAERRELPPPPSNSDPAAGWLSVIGASHHNLKDIDAHFPLGVLTCVTGPSGSGKSSLVNEILYPELAYHLHGAQEVGGPHRRILGLDQVDKVINIDQAPIGQTPRSIPATYTGLFDLIRELYSMLPEAMVRGYGPERFSFNKEGGRCEACEGMGRRLIEMHFLPDVWVQCEECGGTRYNRETLDVKYRGKSIADVLEMTVGEALGHFESFPRIRHILQTMADVGLQYLPLGQPAPMLSGGEAQRVRLARELARPARGHVVYLLDEPTTGLHCADILNLMEVLQRLVAADNTVIIIEHNLDVIKCADWVIDLGPGGGENGGRVVASGTPEDVAEAQASATAPFLAHALQRARREKLSWEAVSGPPGRRAHREALDALAEGAERPWECDGRAWHLGETTPAGERREWEAGALTAFVELACRAMGLDDADWADRRYVTLCPEDGDDWAARARTDRPADVRLQIRAPKGLFDQAGLERELALPTWNELEEVQRYGKRPRVRLQTRSRDYDLITIWGFYEDEVRSQAFQEMVRRALAAETAAVAAE